MMKPKRVRIILLNSVSATIAFLAPSIARAQSADPSSTSSTTATQGVAPASELAERQNPGDIIVTARKRGENILQVPVAITALNAAGLQTRGIRDLNGLNDFVPGLRYENSAANRNDRGFYTLTMRGMYPGDSPNRPATGVFLDGVSIPGGALPGLTDIARVEVVKGPQSAYFGRATFAGAINFITAAPSLTEFKGHAEGLYESYGTTDDSLTVEGPLIKDRLAIRVSGRFYHTDGQYKNYGYGGRLGERQTESFSASLIAKPTDTITIRGFFTKWKDDDGPSAQAALNEQDYNCDAGGTGRKVNGLNYICGGIGNINTARMSQNTAPNGKTDLSFIDYNGRLLKPGFIDHLGLKRDEYQANMTAVWDIGNYDISGSVGNNRNKWAAITETYNRPPDGTGYYSTIYLPYNIKNTSAELRLSSKGTGPFKFMIGGNYYHESVEFQTIAYRNATLSTLTPPSNYLSRAFGIFGSVSYDFTNRLTLNAEGRYQWDQVHQKIMIEGGADDEATFRSFGPRVILNYKANRNLNLYASYARGTRPGAFNISYSTFSPAVHALIAASAGRSVPVAVPEEKIDSYEIGIKGDFFDKRLRVLAAGYYALWRNRQINQNISYTVGNTTSSTSTLFASGKTDLWGIELESHLRVTNRLNLDATFDWAHTKVLYTQCAECLAINGVLDPVGNSMERYPEFSGTAGASYTRPINDRWSAISRVDYVYTGKQYATEANVAYLKPANRVNLSVGVESDRYRIEFFGTNIFNNKVPTNILRTANPNASAAEGANLIILAPADKASFGIRGSAKF